MRLLMKQLFACIVIYALSQGLPYVAENASGNEIEILHEDWEDNNHDNWYFDFIRGDTIIDKTPAHESKYAIKQKSSNEGNWVYIFGDHPRLRLGLIDRVKRKIGMEYVKPQSEMVEDLIIENYFYLSPGFKWPKTGLKLWIVNCFQEWGSGYDKAEGKGKPHSWAPYYMTIAVNSNGEPFGELSRADGLGGEGERWGFYRQNKGKTTTISSGVWNKLRIRLKLNTPGKRDGVFRLWLNDELMCDYQWMNFRGTYTDYGWNHLMMSISANPSHPQQQWISRDDIRILKGDGKVASLSSPGDRILLFEDWEENSVANWDDDFIKGDTTIDSEPVYDGKYAIKQKSSNPGNYVHFFGDHPPIKGRPVEDVIIETYIYPSHGFEWPSHAMKLWIVNCFEKWGAGYNKAKGKGKPHTWAPFYMTIAVDNKGQPFGELVRADGLGGSGELWRGYWQNKGEKLSLMPGVWNKLKIRLKLNTPGEEDGIFRLWVGDYLKCDYNNMNYRGTYTKYGWNHLMMSLHANPSHPQEQWVSRDNVILAVGDGRDEISYRLLNLKKSAQRLQDKKKETTKQTVVNDVKKDQEKGRRQPKAPTGLRLIKTDS